ncbi:MAG TPA: hypothetical protein VGA65_04595 [Hyphomicrobium sp.]
MRRLVGRTSIATIFTLAAGAALHAAEPGANDVPTVTPMESTVLPNAPKVGDKPGGAPTVTPMAPEVGDRAPGAAPSGEASPSVSPTEVIGSPDWPCIQRKVPTISAGQVWDGPPLDEVKGWENDEGIVALTPYLESRRISLEQAEKAIKEYAQSLPEAERDKKLTMLFASVLERINTDRGFVLGRIENFQKRQKARAEELEREGRELAKNNQVIPAADQLGPRDANLTPEQQEYNWNARIFSERQQNLTMACEIPILIEQRAYEIARLIRAQMSS